MISLDGKESSFDDGVGVSKLTEALVTKQYSGGIDGVSTTKWLMAYAPDKSATYVGIERIQGTIGGKRGSLVLLHDGNFQSDIATATLRIVSGTDQLEEGHRSRQIQGRPIRVHPSRPPGDLTDIESAATPTTIGRHAHAIGHNNYLLQARNGVSEKCPPVGRRLLLPVARTIAVRGIAKGAHHHDHNDRQAGRSRDMHRPGLPRHRQRPTLAGGGRLPGCRRDSPSR